MALPSVTWRVPETAAACDAGVKLVVASLAIAGLANGVANGLANANVPLSRSVATKLICVPVMVKLETTTASLVPRMFTVTDVVVPSALATWNVSL